MSGDIYEDGDEPTLGPPIGFKSKTSYDIAPKGTIADLRNQLAEAKARVAALEADYHSILAAMRHCRDVLATNGFETDAVTLNKAIQELKWLACDAALPPPEDKP